MGDNDHESSKEGGGHSQPPPSPPLADPKVIKDDEPKPLIAAPVDPEKEPQKGHESQHEADRKINDKQPSFWKRPSFTDWVMMASTVAIAGATIVNVIYVGGQLAEMHSGGEQTDKLIKINGDLAEASKTQGEAARQQAKTAGDALVASQRAWVGSTDATVVKGPNGSLIKGTVLYINTGKEPAKTQGDVAEYVYSSAEWNNGAAVTALVDRQDACLNNKTISGFRFAWPTSGFSNYILQVPAGRIPEIGTAAWTTNLTTGTDILAVQGCIIYEAFSEIHHTAFCYFYDGRITDPSHLNICTVGNKVD
jgi:hypothetical protein